MVGLQIFPTESDFIRLSPNPGHVFVLLRVITVLILFGRDAESNR